MDLMADTVTYSFQTEIYGDVIYDGVMPIYDSESNRLIGGFIVRHGNLVSCFLSGRGYPTSLAVSSRESFWFTPINDRNGQVSAAYVSNIYINPLSKKIILAEESEQGLHEKSI